MPAGVNGQLAFAHYIWDADAGAFLAHGVNVSPCAATAIADITMFLTPEVFERLGRDHALT